MEDLLKKLGAPFPEEAESTDPARGFTGIKMPYVIERLNDVFGLCGQGWKFEVTRMDIDKERVIAYVSLRYNIDGEWSKPIPASGDMNIIRERVGDAIKGAVSDAIKKAASYLGVGMDAYKGKLGKGNAKPKRKARKGPKPATPHEKQEILKHWIEDEKVRKRFWAFAKGNPEVGGLGLTEDQVHKALTPTGKAEPIASVKDFGGTMAEAKEMLEDYAAAQEAPPAEADLPQPGDVLSQERIAF